MITIIAFNYGKAGRYVNGPGMCLVNFVKKLRQLNVKVNVFSLMTSDEKCFSMNNKIQLEQSIKNSDWVHHWSGLNVLFVDAIKLANKYKIPVLIGPNVLDTVDMKSEQHYLRQIMFDKLLTVNLRLKFRLAKQHQLPINKIDLLLVGPDEEIWKPSNKDNGKILWKGNSKQFVKDVNFGLQIKSSLPEYDFEFLGYPEPYSYDTHIESAKSCHLYISTSLSETMGLALLESYCSGIPSITHPKIYLNVENYKTGIITNRDVESYCDSIREIMEDDTLYRLLSQGARDYVKDNFSGVAQQYLKNYGKNKWN